MDNNGNALIVWYQSDGTNFQIFKSEYRKGVWTHPTSLSDSISLDGQTAYNPQVAMDNNGNAIIVWQQSDASMYHVYHIFKSEYRSAIWKHPTSLSDNISPDGQRAWNPQVAIDNNGNAIIVWYQYDGSTGAFEVFKSEYRSGAWKHPASIADHISPDAVNSLNVVPQVAMDNNGNTIIVWGQTNGATEQVFKSEYRSGVWKHPVNLSDNISPDGKPAWNPQAATNNNGNAVVVWWQYDGTNHQIFKSEYR